MPRLHNTGSTWNRSEIVPHRSWLYDTGTFFIWYSSSPDLLSGQILSQFHIRMDSCKRKGRSRLFWYRFQMDPALCKRGLNSLVCKDLNHYSALLSRLRLLAHLFTTKPSPFTNRIRQYYTPYTPKVKLSQKIFRPPLIKEKSSNIK